MARIISLAALTVLELSPPDMVTCAADAGFTHVGLRLLPPTPQEVSYPLLGDTRLVREVLARLAATGVRVLDVEILRLKPDTRVADFLPVLETGARLGARNVLVAGNDPEESRLVENFGALCDVAASLDMAPSIEPMPWTDVRNLAQAARIVGAVARSNAGILIDPLHFDRAGNSAADIRGIPPAWFRYMQLCDAPGLRPTDTEGLLFQARAERLLPGEGGLDLRGILHALPDDLPIGLEIPMATLAQTVGAVERARRARVATERLLSTL
jgi:sugar phosphate isomerase/epimerase